MICRVTEPVLNAPNPPTPFLRSINEHVPLTVGEAEAQGYYRGSCFDGMGFHYFKDLKSPGGMSWSADALAPVVAMYVLITVNAARHGQHSGAASKAALSLGAAAARSSTDNLSLAQP